MSRGVANGLRLAIFILYFLYCALGLLAILIPPPPGQGYEALQGQAGVFTAITYGLLFISTTILLFSGWLRKWNAVTVALPIIIGVAGLLLAYSLVNTSMLYATIFLTIPIVSEIFSGLTQRSESL